MKSTYPIKTAFLLLCSISAVVSAKAQATLEFANGAGPTGNGTSTSSQVVTFMNNTNNPSGNTFSAFNAPATTVTFAISRVQYQIPAAMIPSKQSVVFGANVNTGSQAALATGIYSPMNTLGGAAASDFTSASGIPAGTGMSLTNNYAVEIFNSAMGLYGLNSATNGNYYMATLTITFSTPVTNPVIHVVGLGATVSLGGGSSLGITSQMALVTTGVTLSKLSGSRELSVTATGIANSATHPSSTTGSGAASGSILVTGSNITALVFNINLRGDGVLPAWSNTGQHTGDAFMVGVSLPVTSLVLPVTMTDFTAVAQAGRTTQLKWATATEDNSAYFDVEYSNDQAAWQSIGSVQAAGNSNAQKNYSFIHDNPTGGANYYRLKEVDKDGNASYSKVCTVDFEQSSRLTFYPNPVKDRVTITNGGTTLGSVTVLSIDGRRLQQINSFTSGGSVDLSAYPIGIYFLAIKNNSGTTEVLKILKN